MDLSLSLRNRNFIKNYDPVPGSIFSAQLDGKDGALTWNSGGGTPTITQGYNTRSFEKMSKPDGLCTWFNKSESEYYSGSGSFINFGTGSATFSFWINTTTTTLQKILGMSGSGGDTNSFELIINNGSIRVKINTITTILGGSVADGLWHFITIVFKGSASDVDLYIDNAFVSTNTNQAYNITPRTIITVGAGSGGGNNLNGFLDDLRIYERELTTGEINTLYNYAYNTNPNTIENNSLWIDAQDQTTITSAASDVSQIDDKSGNSNNSVQAVAANQPTTGTENLNGLNAITFNGTTDLMTVADFINNDENHTAFLVGIRSATIARQNAVINNWSIYHTSTNFNVVLTIPGPANGYSIVGGDISGVRSFRFEQNAPNAGESFMEHFNSGALINTRTLSKTVFRESDSFTLGASGSGSKNCAICEYIYFRKLLTDDKMRMIESYMAWKYGLVSYLPSDHPYKNKPYIV